MKEIKVLGSGCSKCTKTAEAIQKIAEELGVEATVIKETNPQAMLTYKVMSTPEVVIDEKLVHGGSIPHRNQIEKWLTTG